MMRPDWWESDKAARSSTPFTEGGVRTRANVEADGWNVNLHFSDGERMRHYVFDVDQAEVLIGSLQRELLYARRALLGGES